MRNLFKKDNIFIAESGIKNQKDIDTLVSNGIHVFLIGESLMKGDFFLKLRDWQSLKHSPFGGINNKALSKSLPEAVKPFLLFTALKEFLQEYPTKNILIVVPSIALLDQWQESIEALLEVDLSINGGGEQLSEISQVCISTIDSLKNIIESISADNTFLIVDECHKIGTKKTWSTTHQFMGCHIRAIGNSGTRL